MHLFGPYSTVFLALFAGIIFGFLLRKANVTRFDVIVSQLLLKDFTVMKVILTAIVVGSIGIYSFSSLGWITIIPLSETPVLWTALGGGIFGMGMSIAGYCPGTGVASLADGAKDMWMGLLGMIVASLLFNEFSPYLLPIIEKKDVTYQQTLFSFFHVSAPMMIAIVFCIWASFVLLMRRFRVNPTWSG